MKSTKVRTPLKYPGGKNYLAPKIVGLMCPHTRYVEPFFGGGAVLFAKSPEGVSEFVNDIDRRLINFWSCLQNPSIFADFKRIVDAVPFSSQEFSDSGFERSMILRPCLEAGVKFFIRNRQSRQGLGKDYATPTSRTRRGMNENVSAWLSAVDGLPEVHARLRRVEIRNEDAISLIRELDSPDTLFYCDPPYLHETRVAKDQYRHEMTEEQHETLLHVLHRIRGKFLLSGYRSKLYDSFAAVANWHCQEFQIDNKASGRKRKPIMTESVWANYEIQAN